MENHNSRTVCFFGTCLAFSSTVLVSQRVSSPYTIDEIRASFALNTNRTLKLYFFVSADPTAPTIGEPAGFNCLDEYGQVSYLTGDDEQKSIKNNTIIREHPSWLKVYAVNEDFNDHTIDVQVDITIEPRK